MTIPIYRHNQDIDDWEIASVYGTDDCGSLGGSACGESLYSSGSLDHPALRPEGYPYDDARPRFVNGYPVPQPQRQNHTPVPHARPQWDAHYVPGKPSGFIVPPPGIVFPAKDWVVPPQDTYWRSTATQMGPSLDVPMDVGLVETPPPRPLLLMPPSPPPRAPSPLTKRPSPVTIAHGQPPHVTSAVVPGSGAGANVNVHASPMMPPPPRYHEVAHAISPRLADAGCQAHPSTAISPPRRSGHDVLSPYAPPTARAPRSSEEFTLVDGRYGGGGPAGHPGHGACDRPDVHPPPVPGEYEQERPEYDGGRARPARAPMRRERRPSVWQRFVRRFSHTSVGQT